jgi:hypothetical protein
MIQWLFFFPFSDGLEYLIVRNPHNRQGKMMDAQKLTRFQSDVSLLWGFTPLGVVLHICMLATDAMVQ